MTECVEKTGLEFEDLVREHQAMVFSLAYHFLRDRGVAEEIAQEVFLSLHRNLARVESAAHALFWLRQAAVRRSIDEARRRSRRPQVTLEEVPEPRARATVGDPMMGAVLRRLVASLPETPRLVMVLRYQEDLDPPDIARVLEMPLATVKSHLHRSLLLLREKLERRGIREQSLGEA